MPALRNLQDAMLQAVLFEDGAIHSEIVEDGIPAAERVRIHHNNTVITLGASLSAVYPVVQRLVGEDFFDFAAARFVRDQPPVSGSLLAYGEGFSAFLLNMAEAEGLPYLADVARLEWAWHEAFHAEDGDVMGAEAFSRIPNERLHTLRLSLHPSARLILSDYPIWTIWAANQADVSDPPEINLDDGGEQVMVVRPGLEVAVRRLSPGGFAFLTCLQSGGELGQAHQAGLETDVGFDLELELSEMIGGDFFSPLEMT